MTDDKYLTFLIGFLEHLHRQVDAIYSRATLILTSNVAFGAAIYALASPEVFGLRWRADAVAFWLASLGTTAAIAVSIWQLQRAVRHGDYEEFDIAALDEGRRSVIKDDSAEDADPQISRGFIKNAVSACSRYQAVNDLRYNAPGLAFRWASIGAFGLFFAALMRFFTRVF